MPQFVCELDIPTRPEDIVLRYAQPIREGSRARRRRTLVAARGRIQKPIQARSQDAVPPLRDDRRNTRRQKARKYHSTIDLIKTGKSKQEMLSVMKFQIGGRSGGREEGHHDHDDDPVRVQRRNRARCERKVAQGVTIQQMQLELQDADERDGQMISKWILEGYMRRLNQHRQSRQARAVAKEVR
jgi:hypothetical protein